MLIKVAIPNQVQLKLVPSFSTFFVEKKNEIHYIGGAEVLPAPLSAEQEAGAIAKLRGEESAEARKLLIEHNLRLVVYIAGKFHDTGVGMEDLISVGTIGLIKAVHSFDAGRNSKLSTYAFRCIENEIRMYLRRYRRTRREVSLEESLHVDGDGHALMLSDILGREEDTACRNIEDETERRLLERALETLSERERSIIELRFGLKNPGGKEMTQQEVADTLGISQSYLSRLEKKILRRLKGEMLKFM